MIDDLLELADDLVRREPRRPKQVSLRRSVSTAYYALFHALADLCVGALVGWSKPWEAVTPIYRALDHGTAKSLFVKHRNTSRFGPEVARIGEVFVQLQAARHAADYDPEPFGQGRRETLDIIDEARQAVAAIRSLPAETKLLLAVHLVGRAR